MTLWWLAFIATVLVGVGTYLLRSIFIVSSLADRPVPPAIRQALRFVAPAVMAALVVSLLYGDEGGGSVGAVELISLAVGGLVGWRTRSLVWVLVAGMSSLWLLRWLT